MKYVQLYHNSTGYIAGSVPPRFSPDHVKPIELLGSDGILLLDGRYGLDRMIFEADNRAEKMKRIHPDIIGYEIVVANNLLEYGRVIYSTINAVTK
jgi:hypothetical protein